MMGPIKRIFQEATMVFFALKKARADSSYLFCLICALVNVTKALTEDLDPSFQSTVEASSGVKLAREMCK
jgi:hypothetical protein